jgi:transposase
MFFEESDWVSDISATGSIRRQRQHLASPSVLAMLLTTKYADGIPLYRFEKMLSRHGIDIPRQTLARWVIQCGEQLQPLLNLMRDRLLDSPVIHCDETRVHPRAGAQGARARSEQPILDVGAN